MVVKNSRMVDMVAWFVTIAVVVVMVGLTMVAFMAMVVAFTSSPNLMVVMVSLKIMVAGSLTMVVACSLMGSLTVVVA